MEQPGGRPPVPAVLAAQDAIVFSDAASPSGPPGAPIPAPTDVFWASLVRAQMCVWDLQGAIEGTRGGDRHHDGSRCGDVAGIGVPGASLEGMGSCGVTARSFAADGRTSPKFAAARGTSWSESIPTCGTASPKDATARGVSSRGVSSCGVSSRGVSSCGVSSRGVSSRGATAAQSSHTDGRTSPKDATARGISSPGPIPTYGRTSMEDVGTDGISPQSIPAYGRTSVEGADAFGISPQSIAAYGNPSPKDASTHGVTSRGLTSTESIPAYGRTSLEDVGTDGISPQCIPYGRTSPKGAATHGTASTESTPTYGRASVEGADAYGISPQSIPVYGTPSPKDATAHGVTSTESTPTYGRTSAGDVSVYGTTYESIPSYGRTSMEDVDAYGTPPQSIPPYGNPSPKDATACGIALSESIPTSGRSSADDTDIYGVTPQSTPAPKDVSTLGTTSTESILGHGRASLEDVDTYGISPQSIPACGKSTPKDASTHGTPPEPISTYGRTSLEDVGAYGITSPKSVPTDGCTLLEPQSCSSTCGTTSPASVGRSIPREDVPTHGSLSAKSTPTFGTTSSDPTPAAGTTAWGRAPMDGSTSPKAAPVGETTSAELSPADGGPKWSEEEEEEEEEEGGDEDEEEEDGEEEEDVEEEEPHFHTNPLFCGLYKPHLQITEGDIAAAPTMGGTQEVAVSTRRDGDGDSVAERGLELSGPLDSTLAGGHQDPPRLPREGDSAPPSPEHPKDLAPGGGDPEPLSLSHPTAPHHPQKSPTAPDSPPQMSPHHLQGEGHQKPPTPPDSPPHSCPEPLHHLQGGGHQKPPTPPNSSSSTPPYPQGGGQQPHNSPLILPYPSSILPQGGQQLPPRSPQTPPTPFPTSAQPPLGPSGLGGAEGLRGAPPTPGGLCAPEGVMAQLPTPPPVSPHPDIEELPPESGQEPPPDPPAGTHGCPSGGPGGREDAQRLAARLFHLDGFKKSQVASFLRKNNAFSSLVAQEYLEFFQFEGQTLDRALRTFLQALMLTGETQERERILGHFSRRFHHCNPNAFPSPDAVHSLTCAIMLLNTDLHGPRLGRAMSSAEFVANLSGMMDGQDFPKEMLKALYGSIRSEKLPWAADEEEDEEGPTPPTPRKGSTSLVELPRQDGATTFRQGWLARKVLAEAEGKKAPWGRRGWKSFHTVLRGTLLYFLKAGAAPRGPEPAAEAEEPLGVHHALAERASKYTKRPHVFRLQTADRRVLLFQASSEADMTAWISRLNLAAALLSSPPFPAAVGSQRRFARPILPAAPSRCPPEEQQRAHEAWMERVEQELLELQQNLPEKRSRGRELEEQRLHREHLVYERRRFETYVRLLETWLSAERDLESWEGGVPPEPPTLTRAHSSPALGPETAPPGPPRVKRNISERRTVRKVVPKRNRNLL